jgi:FixJ family two-component response regulator
MTQPTVFVVDDVEEARESVCALTKSMGGKCQAYQSGDEFLAAYDPSQTGCLVTDLRMHGISGLELQSEIIRRGWTLPVVLVSGYIGVQNTVHAMKHGAVDVLTKPYRDQDLWDAIQVAFRRDEQLRRKLAHGEAIHRQFSQLTLEERQVLDLIVTGSANKAVAHRLGIGLRTVEDRRRRIMDKVHVDSFAGLMTMFAELKEFEAQGHEAKT